LEQAARLARRVAGATSSKHNSRVSPKRNDQPNSSARPTCNDKPKSSDNFDDNLRTYRELMEEILGDAN
jgi:hypothetical protein